MFGKLYANTDSHIINAVRSRISAHFGVDANEDKPKAFRLQWTGDRLPYIDEFQYCKAYDENAGTITLSRNSGDDKHGIVREHETGWHPTEEGTPRHNCESCGDAMDDEEMYYVNHDTYCCDCIAWCEIWDDEPCVASEVDQHVVYYDGRERTMSICESALSDLFTSTDVPNDVRYVEDCSLITLDDGRDCSPEWAALVYDVDGAPFDVSVCVELDDEWYGIEDKRICEVDGDWYLRTNDVVREILGVWVLVSDLASIGEKI